MTQLSFDVQRCSHTMAILDNGPRALRHVSRSTFEYVYGT